MTVGREQRVAMRLLVRVLPLLLLPLLLLPSAARAESIAAGDVAAMTLAGERCSTQVRNDVAAVGLQPPDADLMCAGKKVGKLAYALAPPVGSHPLGAQSTLSAAFVSSPAAASVRSDLECEAEHWLTDKNGPVLLFPCRQKNDGWPVLVMARLDDELLTIVEGPASTYPVLRAIMKLPDRGLLPSQLTAEAQSYWSKPVAMASAADLEDIKTKLRDARVAASQLNYPAAEAGFRLALALQSRLFGENDLSTNEILLDLALTVSNEHRLDEADALMRRAAPIADRSIRPADRARLTAYEGYLAANRGAFAEALTFARAATGAWRKIATAAGSPGGPAKMVSQGDNGSAAEAELAHALNFEAAMMLRNDDATGAFAAAGEALLIIDKVEDKPRWWKSDILLTLGEISSAQGRLSAAEAYLKGALQQRLELFGEGASTLKVRTALGAAYQAEQMNTSAIIAYREAIKVAHGLPKSSVAFTADDLVPFAAAIVGYAKTVKDPAARAGLYAEGFDAFQLVKSPLIDRSMALTSARLSADSPELAGLIRRLQTATSEEGSARLQLAHEQSLDAQERSGLVEDRLAREIADDRREVIAARAAITSRFPRFGELSEPELPTLDAVRARLKEHDGLVSFLIGHDRSFVELVRRDGVVIAPVPEGAADLQASVLRLRKGLQVEGRSVNEFDLETAHQLYIDLFGGIQQELATVDRLVVIPSGPLSSLPFGVLVTRPAVAHDYRGAAWLTQEKTLSHVPSLASFIDLRSTRLVGNQPHLLLAFGDPVLGPAQSDSGQRKALAAFTGACLSGGVTPPELLRSLASLPDTAGEITSVARSLQSSNVTIKLGHEANEQVLRGEPLDQFRILYFATHGLLPGELRCQSEPGLVLTPPAQPAASHEFDGLLDASEIARLSIKADLVVLSACNTAAAGDNLGGESLSGLASAFFQAGARTLVVSHWQVPSAATKRLMSTMFGAMGAQRDMTVDTALQRAQIDMIRDPATAHPFFWGAFVVMGDGATRPLQNRDAI